MNKPEVVKQVAKNVKMKPQEIERIIGEFFDVIGETVAKGEKVKLVGFGTFSSRKRSARVGINPQTGKEVEIAESSLPTFRAGKHFKAKVREGSAR